EVEGPQLEHHAKQAQGGTRRPRDVVTEDANLPTLRGKEPCDQGEQRALACAVEPKQDDKGRRRNRKADVGEGLPRPIGVADPIDRQCRRDGSPGLRFGLLLDRDHHGSAMKTPQGCSPTWIVLTTFKLATSMTETSFDRPLVARRYFSSGVKANCQTRWPTSR